MSEIKSIDLIIENGLVLTMLPDQPPIENGWIAVDQGEIIAFGAMTDRPADLRPAQRIDASDGLVMPGLINTHVHSAMTLFRGLADDLPLDVWLYQHIFPAERDHVDEDLVYWGTRLACVEMLLSGTTTAVDGYFLEEQTARAARDSGMRMILGQGVIDFPAPGVPDPSLNIEHAREFIQKTKGLSSRLSPSVFCHSPYTCSPETLVKGKNLARDEGVLFQIHAAETAGEVEAVSKDRGLTPIRYLEDLGLLDERTLVVHAVHLDDEEIEILAQTRAGVSLCVQSNMKLASGFPKVDRMLNAGVRLSLGTDGPAGNNDLNLFGEMKSLALAVKAYGLDPTLAPAHEVLALACSSGARALGLEKQIGVIRPGGRADLIVLDLTRPNLKPLYNPASHLVYAASGREVRTVLVDGRVLVEEGRPTNADLAEIMARVRELASGLGPK